MAWKRNSEYYSCVSNTWIILTIFVGTIFHTHGAPSVPAIFVFGDSTADVGTNNYLPLSAAKANMRFHGIDYPGSKPTGRFSNGYNTVDFLAQFLGFKESPPPFLYLQRNQGLMKNIVTGANFASGGSGVLDITGKRPYKQVVPLLEQIRQFAVARNTLVKTLNNTLRANTLISNSLFIFSAGNNDIFEHFVFDKIPPKGDPFVRNLVATYENHIKALIRLGAKRLGVLGVSPIGCVPSMRIQSPTFGCFQPMNAYAKEFNLGLEALMKRLRLQGGQPLKYSIAQSYQMTTNLMTNPTQYGITDGKSACCGNGIKLNAEERCNARSRVCKDRTTQLFWDQFHPTEKVSKLVATALYNSGFRIMS